MKGIDIFVHAVRMVLNNLGMALRISLSLMALLLVVVLVLGTGGVMMGRMDSSLAVGSYGMGAIFVTAVLSIVIWLWIAVAWHRFVLREEMPTGFLPAFNGGAIGAYLVACIIFGLILFAVALPIALLSGLILAPMVMTTAGPPGIVTGFVMFVVIYLPLAYVAYRISPILPSAALGARLPVREAWYATGAAGIDFIGLAVVSVMASYVLNLPGILMADSLPGVIWGFAANWISVMVGASVLTTIYGHYVEGRALNV